MTYATLIVSFLILLVLVIARVQSNRTGAGTVGHMALGYVVVGHHSMGLRK